MKEPRVTPIRAAASPRPAAKGRRCAGEGLRRVAPFVLALTAVLLAACSHEDTAQTGPSVLVQLTPLHRGSLPSTVTVLGTVQASAASRQTITAPAAAIVAGIAVRLGERVPKDAPLVRLAPTPQTAAAYAQARSALRAATQLVASTKQLLGQHLATQQQLADARRSASDAGAALAALDAQGAGGTNTLKAPFASIVTVLSTSRGAIVTEGVPLLELAEVGGLVLHGGVVPAAAGAVVRGNRALITPIGAAHAVAGSVSLRGAAVDPTTGLTPIEITMPAGALQPGETAQAVVTTGAVSGYLAPHEAVLLDDAGNPYVVQDVKGTAKKVSVNVLASEGEKDIVAGRLDPTAPLVLAGNYQLQDGMKLRVAQPVPAEAQRTEAQAGAAQ